MKAKRPTREPRIRGAPDTPELRKAAADIAALGFTMTVITANEAREREAARKEKLGIYTREDFKRLGFPGWFTLHFDYFATGEGSTRGICVSYCMDLTALDRCIAQCFGPFYGQDVEVREGVRPLPGYGALIPSLAKKHLKEIEQGHMRAMFSFHSVAHVNYS